MVLIGIDTGDSEETFREEAENLGVDWLCAWQGPESSPIADLYHVRGYPTILILDAEGNIRATNVRGGAVGRIVSELLSAMDE
jgi:hypothetical protein